MGSATLRRALNVLNAPVRLIVFFCLTTLVGTVSANVAHGQTSYNDTPGASGCDGAIAEADWTDPDCWNQGKVPNSSNANVTLDNDVTWEFVDGSTTITVSSLTITSGTFNSSAQNVDFTVEGELDNDDTFNLGGGIATVNSFTNDGLMKLQGGSLTAESGSESGTGGFGATLNLGTGGTLDVKGNFTNGGGSTLKLQDGTLSVSGNLTNNNSIQSNTGALVEFDGDSEQVLSGDYSGTNGNAFQDLTVRAGAFVDPDNSLSIDGSENPIQIEGVLTVESGGQYGEGNPTLGTVNEKSDLTYTGSDFSVTGDLFANEVKFSSSNISSDGSTVVTGAVFAEVNVKNDTKVVVGDANFNVIGKLTVADGSVLDVASNNTTLKLEGDVVINGSGSGDGALLTTPGTVVFQGEGRSTCCSFGDDGSLTGTSNNKQEITGTADLKFGTLQVKDVDSDDSIPETVVQTSESTIAITVNDDLTIDEATLEISRPLKLLGNLVAEGGGDFVVKNDKRLTFAGGSDRSVTTPGGLSVTTVEVDKGSSTLTLNDPLTVTDRLILSDGTVASNGNLTFPSTGYINYGSGSITGNVTAKRELGGQQNWYFLSPPGKNISYEQFLEQGGSNDLWVQGVAGGDVPDATDAANLYYYDESITSDQNGSGAYDRKDGWAVVGNMSDKPDPDKGILMYIFDDDGATSGFPKLIDSETPLRFSNSYTYSLSATDANSDGFDVEDGWNLIGNPYLAPIDWDDLSKTNISGTVYIHVPGGGYKTYSQGAAGPTPFEEYGYISPFQSFFVRATSGSPSLSIDDITTAQVTESDRSADGAAEESDPFLGKSSSESTPGVLRLALEKGDYQASTQFLFRDGASFKKDRLDGYELKSFTNTTLSLYSVLGNGNGLSINNLPRTIEEKTRIPIGASARGCSGDQPLGGTVTMTWPDQRNLPADWGLKLVDTSSEEQVDLRGADSYTFTLDGEASSCSEAKASSTSSNSVPSLPTPTVVKNPSIKKDGGPSTRFELVIEPNAVLPVEISGFEGSVEGKDVVLSWETSSETNNSGFRIQRQESEDGSFKTVGTVKSKAEGGTSTQTLSYTHRVDDLDAGTHSFRLKQVDLDGNTSVSDPIDVKVGLRGKYTFATYPNPVQNQGTVEFAIKNKGSVTVELYNTLGQRVKTLYQDTVPAEETQQISLDTGGLSSGLYFLRLRTRNGISATRKITVVQ